MDVSCGMIKDPVIAPSGKLFSGAGLKRLIEEICRIDVDNATLLWRRNKCHEKRRRKESTKLG